MTGPIARCAGIWLSNSGSIGASPTLVDELNALAVTEPGGAQWETIQKAQANSGVSVGRIIAAIRAPKIRVHAQPGKRVYYGFMVCRGEFGMIQ